LSGWLDQDGRLKLEEGIDSRQARDYNGHTKLYTLVVVELAELARELNANGRTLRRAAADGTIRCERASVRHQLVSEDERMYLAAHWQLLSALRRALRTEPNVRLAVLYGSAARGEDTPDSDVDLLVSLGEDHADAAVKLAGRIERVLGRDVDVARLNRVWDAAPLLLLQATDDGRVVLDRDDEWSDLKARRSEIAGRARNAHDARRRRARTSIRELLAAEE
jgi:predicted nucleotidyltransferase